MTPKHLLHAWILAAALGACAAAAAQDKLQDKGASFSDDVITERVESALQRDPELREMRIVVRTRERVVHLRGVVNSEGLADRAEALASRIEGVSAVRNAIHVIIVSRRSRA